MTNPSLSGAFSYAGSSLSTPLKPDEGVHLAPNRPPVIACHYLASLEEQKRLRALGM